MANKTIYKLQDGERRHSHIYSGQDGERRPATRVSASFEIEIHPSPHLLVVARLRDHFRRHKVGRADERLRLLAADRPQPCGHAEIGQPHLAVLFVQQHVGR